MQLVGTGFGIPIIGPVGRLQEYEMYETITPTGAPLEQSIEATELRRELRDGTISTLSRYAPQLIAGIDGAFSMVHDIIRFDPEIIGEAGPVRPMRPSDLSLIREALEVRSVARFGVKLRTDRVTVSELVRTYAERDARDSEPWIEEVGVWDGVDRLKDILPRLGLHPFYDQGGSHDRFIEVAGRYLFMRPVQKALGIENDETFSPLVVVMNSAYHVEDGLDRPPTREVKRILEGFARGTGSVHESQTVVAHEQDFTESFDPMGSHLLLPGVVQVTGAQYRADITRFEAVVRKGFAFYRPPNSGRSKGIQTNLPLMVGTLKREDWQKVADSVDVLALYVDPDRPDLPDLHEINQCYAQALEQALGGVPIVPPRLRGAVKTDYRTRSRYGRYL